MIRRASTEKMPSHMMRQTSRRWSINDKIKQAQGNSLASRDVKVTLKKAPWEADNDLSAPLPPEKG